MKFDQYSIEQGHYLLLSKIYTSLNETQDFSNQFDILHLKYCQAGFLSILYVHSLFSKVKRQM